MCTNNGLRALFYLMKDAAEHVRQEEGVDLCLTEAHETADALEPYLQALLGYLREASPEEIKGIRDSGSSLAAVRNQAYRLEAQLRNRLPGFEPAGLKKYLRSHDEAGTAEAAGHIRDIQQRLFAYVTGSLRKELGDASWWWDGVPSSIKSRCAQARDADNAERARESYLYLIDYREICLANWNLMKEAISLGAKNRDNKRQNTAWIKRLNDLRNVTAHPERGPLDTQDVAWVRDLADRVAEHLSGTP